MRYPVYVGSNSYVWNTSLDDWRKIEKLYFKLNTNRINYTSVYYDFVKRAWRNISNKESGVELFCIRNLKKNNVLMFFDANGNHYNENVTDLKLENYKISLGYFNTPIESMINKRLFRMISSTRRSDFVSKVFLISITKYLTDNLHHDHLTMVKRIYKFTNEEREYGFTGSEIMRHANQVKMLWSPFNKVVDVS